MRGHIILSHAFMLDAKAVTPVLSTKEKKKVAFRRKKVVEFSYWKSAGKIYSIYQEQALPNMKIFISVYV
jgi:hypothetical protein